ncbi:unnamed protein product [Parascedosporium putredinis]|uniref:FAD-binding domain-containing protein n=1 Tax=Parascedosporium putredinis TaxID=1442378 RepID=A0A9P1H058_9PEZI|nr:unnamed protein product [Parascedosporium putredinis]CAI7991780.1 unnamed protein product [Parascedosporium putredinis]
MSWARVPAATMDRHRFLGGPAACLGEHAGKESQNKVDLVHLPYARGATPRLPARLDVIVVGAGLSGLASAIAIALSGHAVTVFEAAKELQEVGAGLQMTPNATRILRRLGIPTRFWEQAAEPTFVQVHRYSGEVLMTDPAFDVGMRAKYGAPFVDVHRVDLQLTLYERARALGVRFHLDERIHSVDFDMPEVITSSGAVFEADLIAASDGDLAYRIVLELDQIADPELADWVRNPSVHFWAGPGAHAVGYSLRAGKMYNIVLLVPDNLPANVYKDTGSVDEMRELFKDWDPILNRFLALVSKVDRWKLMHREELPSGDSCHPMLPYLAQGANSAIEDGTVLGLLLGHLQSKEQLPQALKMYEALRKSRGEAIVKEAFKQRDSFHMVDGPEQEARDALLRAPIKAPYPSRWSCPQVQSWLYGYDAFKEVEEAIAAKPYTSTATQVIPLFPPLSRRRGYQRQSSHSSGPGSSFEGKVPDSKDASGTASSTVAEGEAAKEDKAGEARVEDATPAGKQGAGTTKQRGGLLARLRRILCIE